MSRYIDTNAFEVFGYNKTEGASEEYNDGFDDGVQYVLECIDNVPTADVKPVVRGEWIPIGEPDKDNNQQVECSHCHAGDLHAVGVEVPYCWKCGADMRGEV